MTGTLISLTHATFDKFTTHFTRETISWTGIRVPLYSEMAFSAPSSNRISAASSPGLMQVTAILSSLTCSRRAFVIPRSPNLEVTN